MSRKRTWGVAIPTMLLCVAVWLSGATTTHVVIMHTNDIHGHILPEDGSTGLAIIATIVKQQHPDILLDAGDMFTGTILSDTFHGESVMAVMNRMGFRASILGNHEFDYGVDVLRERMHQAEFPILSANVVLPAEHIPATQVLTVKGIRFGIVGLTTEEAAVTGHPKIMKDVEIKDVVHAVEENLPRLRQTSDFIVVLGHLLPEEELRVARAFPEIKLIISGHSHVELQEPIHEGETTIVRTGNVGRFVGRLDLDFDDHRLSRISEHLIEAAGVAPDPDALDAAAPYIHQVEQQMNTVLGVATASLSKDLDKGGAMLNLIADAFRAEAGTQIALENTGGVRISLPAGPITYGKVFEALPFENTIITMKLTGAQLKRSLNVNVTAISGLRAVFDTRKPKNARLVSVTLADGSPIVDDATYTVAINDFMQAGGDGYTEFAHGVDVKDTGIRLRDSVSDYIKTQAKVIPPVDGRIRIIQ